MTEVKVVEAQTLPEATPVLGRRIKLSKGPDWAKPCEQEQVLGDGSRSQRYSTKGGTLLRRTLAPRDLHEHKQIYLPGRPPAIWWEYELG